MHQIPSIPTQLLRKKRVRRLPHGLEGRFDNFSTRQHIQVDDSTTAVATEHLSKNREVLAQETLCIY